MIDVMLRKAKFSCVLVAFVGRLLRLVSVQCVLAHLLPFIKSIVCKC